MLRNKLMIVGLADLLFMVDFKATDAELTGAALPMDATLAAARAVLDLLSGGVFVVDGVGHVLMANAQAQAFVTSDGPLTLHDGRLSGATPDSAQILDVALRILRRPDYVSPYAVSLPRDGNLRPLSVMMRRLDGSSDTLDLIVVHILASENARPPDVGLLRALFDLTPAEAVLLHALMRDHRIDDVAAERGVAVTTIRTQLAHLFRKTGTNRQSELVRLAFTATGCLNMGAVANRAE